MIYYGWTREYILWRLSDEQVLWWHDVLMNRLFGTPLERRSGWKTAAEIRAEFERDEQGRWRGCRQR
jgi:hypothetical protein